MTTCTQRVATGSLVHSASRPGKRFHSHLSNYHLYMPCHHLANICINERLTDPPVHLALHASNHPPSYPSVNRPHMPCRLPATTYSQRAIDAPSLVSHITSQHGDHLPPLLVHSTSYPNNHLTAGPPPTLHFANHKHPFPSTSVHLIPTPREPDIRHLYPSYIAIQQPSTPALASWSNNPICRVPAAIGTFVHTTGNDSHLIYSIAP
jgi:hypothetical protein